MPARRVAVLALIAVALIGGAEFAAGQIERDSAVRAAQRLQLAQRLMTSMLNQQTGARGYFETGDRDLLSPWYSGSVDFAQALAASRRLVAGDPALGTGLRGQAVRAATWRLAVAGEIAHQQVTGRAPTVEQTLSDEARFDLFRSADAIYTSQLIDRGDASQRTANRLVAGLVAVLTIVLMAAGIVVARRGGARAAARTARRRELRELLQVSASEPESQQLLIRHVERVIPGAGAAVLTRSEVDDGLAAALLADAPAGAGPLQDIQLDRLQRRSCMAVRLSRTYERGRDAGSLQACDVCGRLAGAVACQPLLVGDRVIGSVLVARDAPITNPERTELRESVLQAAPIFAAQRSLRLAEWRAASDALTGLPNRRAADETARRMVAHAGRTLTPVAVVLLDLDGYQQINDRYGRDQGDTALAVIGQVLANSVRASDFAARYGGEEFIVFLPNTDRRGAIEAGEKIRSAIAHAEILGVGSLTASLGVAALPEDAIDAEQLIRKADRALYVAKARGRNRLESAAPSTDGIPLSRPPEDLLGGSDDLLGT